MHDSAMLENWSFITEINMFLKSCFVELLHIETYFKQKISYVQIS
jgi:hypothetical protein